MNGDRSYTGAARKISNQWRSSCFLKIGTEGAKTRCAGGHPEVVAAAWNEGPVAAASLCMGG